MDAQLQSGNVVEEVVKKEYFEHLTIENIMGLEWPNEDDAYEFYQKYGLAHGFGTRKDRYRRNRNGKLLYRSFVCACEGSRSEKDNNKPERKRAQRPITRCGCQATLRIEQNMVRNTWTVNKFVADHNHPLLHRHVAKFHRSHREIDEVEEAQVYSLHDHRMKTSHIMSYMASQSGGFSGVDFTRKDLYNRLDRRRRKDTRGGDAMAALTYLKGISVNDSRFFMKHTIDDEGCMDKLFWSDGISRIDYKCFGDVVAFDSTYKKNKYNKPLVIFSGINHHEQSVVFACCLLSNETEDSYKWVLRTLVEAMDGKNPVSFVTDGDKAMRNAIVELFPDDTHRLCSWHLQQNAQSNTKQKEFVREFGKLATANIDVDQFESRWADLIDKCGLSQNEWVQEVYTKRHLWASAHLRGKMTCGFTTTSRCEGINAYVGTYVDRKYNLLEFVQQINKALDSMRYNELQADYNSQFGKFVLCTAYDALERSTAELYTKEAFIVFQEALLEASAWTVDEVQNICGSLVYYVKKYMMSDKRYQVCYDPEPVSQRMQCECGMLHSYGMPCPHMLCVMAYEDFACLISSVVNKRWTKNVKQDEIRYMEEISESSNQNHADVVKSRVASLGHSLRRLIHLASERTEDFYVIRDQVQRMIIDLEEKRENETTATFGSNCDVRDPAVVRSKGRPVGECSGLSRPRKCGRCKQVGHNRSTCTVGLLESSPECSWASISQDYE